jgi:hypothetical protein
MEFGKFSCGLTAFTDFFHGNILENRYFMIFIIQIFSRYFIEMFSNLWLGSAPWLRLLVSGLSHHEGPDLCLSQSIWDLWWTKWNWDRFLFPSSLVFPCHCYFTVALHTLYITWGWTLGLFVSPVQRHSLTPSTWTALWLYVFEM